MEMLDITHRGRRIVVSSTTLPNPRAEPATVYQMTVDGHPIHGANLPADSVIRALGQAMHAERDNLRYATATQLIDELERRRAAGEIEAHVVLKSRS